MFPSQLSIGNLLKSDYHIGNGQKLINILKSNRKRPKNYVEKVNHLYETKKELILDDEKYFRLSCDEIPGNSGLYTDNIEECPDDVRFKAKDKFPIKVLVWVAFSAKGII